MHSKVTIAIPTLNRAEYLRIALASALTQTYSNLEVIVSNNASSDHTASVLALESDPRLHVLEQTKTLGMMENWNACLSAASGKYFLLLSDDDVLESTAIEEMVKVFEEGEREGSKIGFVYCGGKVIDESGRILSPGRKAPTVESAGKLVVAFLDGKRNLWPCVILFRKDDLAPGYDVHFPLGADAAQWMRVVCAYGNARFVDRKLACYRVHQNTTAKTRVDTWRRENEALGEFAIGALGRNGGAGDQLARQIRRSVSRLNARITSELINQSLRDKKRVAISEYWANKRVFSGGYGFGILIKGLFLMMLPNQFRAQVRRCLYG